MANKEFTPGKIIFVKNDGAFLAGSGASYRREALPGIAEVVIKGVVYWIQADRLAATYGE